MSFPLAARTLDTMAPQSIIGLPCELRHMIYKYYFTAEQGYHFNAASRKLTTAHGEPIDLALMYTCHFIAEETKEMPFLYNDISFKTFYQEDLSSWLCRFDRLVDTQFKQLLQLLTQLRPFITPEIQLRIQEKFPWFTIHPPNGLSYHDDPWLEEIDEFPHELNGPSLAAVAKPPDNLMYADICSSDRAHSAQREAITFTLRLLCESSGEQFIANVDKTLIGWEYSGGARLSNFLDRCYEPWRFPLSLSDLEEMGARRYGYGDGWTLINSWKTSTRHGMQYRPLYRFSAASAAIGFLDALPIKTRPSLRNIIIHEDRVSAGYSDGHAIGLIPFCQENRQLRIRHKFSMVRNLIERAYLSQGCTFDDIQDEKDELSAEIMLGVAATSLYSIVSNCLAEAMYLPDAGMPDGSYTLLLDGEDAGDLCSEIFQKDVLRRETKRLVLNRALKEDPNSDWANNHSFEIRSITKRHARALRHLVNNTSFLESNFNPGHFDNEDAFMAHYKAVGMQYCALEVAYGGSASGALGYYYDLTLFSPVPNFGPMLMENFECLELPGSSSWPMTVTAFI